MKYCKCGKEATKIMKVHNQNNPFSQYTYDYYYLCDKHTIEFKEYLDNKQ